MEFGKYKFFADPTGPGLFNAMKQAKAQTAKKAVVVNKNGPHKPMVEGKYVQLKGMEWSSGLGIGVSEDMARISEGGGYGQIVDAGGRSSHVRIFLETGGHNSYNVANNDMEMLPNEQQKQFDTVLVKWREGFQKKQEAQFVELRAECERALAPVTTPFGELNFLNLQPALTAWNQYLETGVMVDGKKYMKYRLYKGDGVSEILVSEQDNGDFMAYLPVQWVGAAGYSEREVMAWLKLVEEMGFDVPLVYLGVSPLEEYEEYPTLNHVLDGLRYGHGFSANRHLNYAITRNEYYKIHIQGCECGPVNNLIQKLLVALYHRDMRRLPGLTLQLKDALGAQVTGWQAFLMSLLADSEQVFSATTANLRHTVVVAPFASENAVDYCAQRLGEGVPLPSMLAHQELRYPEYVKLMGLLHERDFENLLITYKAL